jgi:hypothetical protein
MSRRPLKSTDKRRTKSGSDGGGRHKIEASENGSGGGFSLFNDRRKGKNGTGKRAS